MWSSRLFWKVFLANTSVYLVFGLAYFLIVAPRQEAMLFDQMRQRLTQNLLLVRPQIESSLLNRDDETLRATVDDIGRRSQLRVTIVAPDGTVIADSQVNPATMENHLTEDRKELKDALIQQYGEAIRLSESEGVLEYYVATKILNESQTAGRLRVALPLKSIEEQIAEMHRTVLFLLAGAGLLTLPFSLAIVNRIRGPLSKINTYVREMDEQNHKDLAVDGNDEIAQLGKSVEITHERMMRHFETLRRNSDQMLTVLSGMAEGVLAVDPNQRLMLANEACRTLLEVSARDVVGRPLLEVVRSRDIQQMVVDAMLLGKSCTREVTLSSGHRKTLRLLAAPLPGSPCPGVVVMLHDITELKRLESLRRDFVANVSHELKTPLAAIKAYAETLRMGAINDPENSLTFVERIEEQANRLHQLILDLLHLARVETGKEAFDIETVSVAEALEEALARHSESAASAGVTFECPSNGPDVLVRADPEGLQTILDNLISNAIKYTRSGGRVTVTARRDGPFGVIDVHDTGIGIAPRDQQRVFERFYRADRARSRELGGTGLGLAIVKHLVQAFGGDVGLESELGQGSTFQVRLPLVENS